MTSTNYTDADEWRPLPAYRGLYEISANGDVRRTQSGLILKQQIRGSNGYLSVNLSKDGKCRRFQVHRLVLEAFVGPCPDGMEACHNNGVRMDNRFSNLRWDTHKANVADIVNHGRRPSTHCKRGHEFTEDNTYLRSNGRECKACRVVHMRNFKARKAVA